MSLPLTGYHSYEHYVKDLDRAERFYVDKLKFKRIGVSTPEAVQREGMQRLVLAGGPDIHLILSAPKQPWSVAAQYLDLHPEGIGLLNFRVSNLDQAVAWLKPRRANFLFDPIETADSHGVMGQVAIATALDDVNYRFVDDSRYQGFAPSFAMSAKAGSYQSPLGFLGVDHVTSNVRALQPLSAFYREVMGFERFWEIEFHTNDVNPSLPVGSGLYSEVYWHPQSGIKFANNEPIAPFFRNSQIEIYCRENRGSGVQHLAFSVNDILTTMRALQDSEVEFLKAGQGYYERVPKRLNQAGFAGAIKEDMQALKQHDILIDGSSKGYLLQIFAKEMARQLGDAACGPLFYEIIQRCGDEGFGGGNFRALFETIEIDQIALKKVADKLPLELI